MHNSYTQAKSLRCNPQINTRIDINLKNMVYFLPFLLSVPPSIKNRTLISLQSPIILHRLLNIEPKQAQSHTSTTELARITRACKATVGIRFVHSWRRSSISSKM